MSAVRTHLSSSMKFSMIFQVETLFGELSTNAQTKKLVPETTAPGCSTHIWQIYNTSGAHLGLRARSGFLWLLIPVLLSALLLIRASHLSRHKYSDTTQRTLITAGIIDTGSYLATMYRFLSQDKKTNGFPSFAADGLSCFPA